MSRPLPLALLSLALLGAGCGTGDSGEDRLTVVATTAFAAELTSAVAGKDADVAQLVPSSANPHSYGASAKDRAELDRAALIVAFGHGYEEGLPLEDAGGQLFEIAERVGSGPDPHVWMDPLLMAEAATELGELLAETDPGNAAAYRRRAEAHRKRLTALDGELRRTLAAVPARRRKLVTSHDSLAYFAERYGFTVVATPFGLAPEAQVSAEGLADVIAKVRAQDVPVVFGQQGDEPRVIRRVAEEAGVVVDDSLLIENPGPQGASYADALRYDAQRIADALAP